MHILVGGPVHAWKGFLACGDQKKSWVFLGCIHVFDLVLKYGSDMNEGNWLGLLFYFIALMGLVAFVIGMSFFSAVFQVSDWSFLVLNFEGNVCNLIPKVIWSSMDWFLGFSFGNGLPRWLHICMDWNLQKLLICYLILKTSKFFDV